MGTLFGAYFVLWSLTFGYLFALGARQKRLQHELTLLQGREPASRQDRVR
jgi:CcmD family protein